MLTIICVSTLRICLSLITYNVISIVILAATPLSFMIFLLAKGIIPKFGEPGETFLHMLSIRSYFVILAVTILTNLRDIVWTTFRHLIWHENDLKSSVSYGVEMPLEERMLNRLVCC